MCVEYGEFAYIIRELLIMQGVKKGGGGGGSQEGAPWSPHPPYHPLTTPFPINTYYIYNKKWNEQGVGLYVSD